MKIILTSQEKQQVEVAAVQKLVQDKLTNMIEARAEEMLRELNDDGAVMDTFQGEPTYTLKDIHKRFLSARPVIDTSSAAKTLLVPAGVDVSKVKV